MPPEASPDAASDAGPTATSGSGRRLRTDAERNRRAILAAATDVFSEMGLDVSVDEIARRAGVGSATLYRRFPTRTDLLAAAVEERIAAYADLIEAACEEPNAWTGFCQMLYDICQLQAADAGLRDLLAMTHWDPPVAGEHTGRALRALEKLIALAKQQGGLRQDFLPADVTMLFMANSGIVAAGGDATSYTRKRHIRYLIESFTA